MNQKYIKTISTLMVSALTFTMLATGSLQDNVKAATNSNIPVAPEEATASCLTKNSTLPTNTAKPATAPAISTPEPTPFETPSTNQITVSDILSLSKKTIFVTPGSTHYLIYNASATPVVKSSNKKVVVATLHNRKLKLAIPAQAEKGSIAKVTLTLGTLKKTLTVQVYNKTKKIQFTQKQIQFKKGKTKNITVKLQTENRKRKTTDDIRVVSKKRTILQIKKVKTANKKITISAKGKKKGKTTIQIQVGKKKKNITCHVK